MVKRELASASSSPSVNGSRLFGYFCMIVVARGGWLGICFDERIAGGWCSLWPPDQALESKNEGVYFWRAQRNLYH